MDIMPQDAAALLEPPYPASTMGSPMWLPGSHTLSNPHPNLRSSSFHRFVLSLWEPDASHLFQCQMKLNICSFQGLWLAINKLANKDLVCWGDGGSPCGLQESGCVRGWDAGGYAGLCVHFSLTKPLISEWLSTPEQLAGLSIVSKLYLVIYTKFVYCTVYVYKQHLSNLPNLSKGISEAAFGA